MTHPRFALLALFALLTITTNIQAVDKEKLRRAVYLPTISVVVGYGVSGRGEFVNLGDQSAKLEKIKKIEKELKVDGTDAECYHHLGQLYGETGQSAKSIEAFHKAEKLFRHQLERWPDKNALRLLLADTLDELDQHKEAETLLRLAVKDCPDDWQSWVGLGRMLDYKSHRAITNSKPFYWGRPDKIMQSMRAAAPTSEQIAAARRYRKEAITCFDRAVTLAPRESDVYRIRGASLYNYARYDFGLRLYKGEKVDFAECFLGREAMPDLRKAVDLRRDEYTGIGMVVMMEILAEANQYRLRNLPGKKTEKMLDVLSESTRKRVREDMARLEEGVQDPDKYKAAEAAEVLGFFQGVVYADQSAAEKSLRRSIALDPSRDAAWESLSVLLLTAEEYRKEVDLCRQRLEYRDSSHNRLLLAKAYEYLDELDRAEVVIRIGLKHEPDDFILNLALADVLLMHGESEGLKQAGEILYKMRGDELHETGTENRWANYTFACGVFFGLIGEKEQAHRWLDKFQKQQPEYPRIKEALQALDAPSEPVSPQPQP